MKLADIHIGISKYKKAKRIGRGPGSGQGKTAGKGHKGQKSRAGYSGRAGFQGGAMPLVRRVPKRGFHNAFALDIAILNLNTLERCFASGDDVNLATLREKRVLKGSFDEYKVLGNGTLTKKLKVAAHRFSKSAEDAIRKAGGEVIVLPGRKAPAETAS